MSDKRVLRDNFCLLYANPAIGGKLVSRAVPDWPCKVEVPLGCPPPFGLRAFHGHASLFQIIPASEPHKGILGVIEGRMPAPMT